METQTTIEPLESRIAPATLVNPTTVTYTDVDFDLVTVKISKGTFADPNVSTDDFTFTGIPAFGQRLVLIDLSNDGTMFDGATLTITATRTAGGGDGHVNVGFIDASGNDLGTVSIAGDLGRIVAGDADTATPGLKKLAVQSMGQFGTSTQSGGNLQTAITGPLGSLVVKGNIQDAAIDVFGGADGTIGSVSVGGSLIGGAASGSGSIESSGAMGAVKIGGDLRGGDGSLSGQLLSNGDMGAVKIGGDLVGGSATDAGSVRSFLGKMGPVTIGGSVIGGTALETGLVKSNGDMGAVKIGGSLEGGSGDNTGEINSGGRMASLTVGGSIVASSVAGAVPNARISANKIGVVKIGGSVVGGPANFSGNITANEIASVAIGGSLIGGLGDFSGVIDTLPSGVLGTVKIAGNIVGGSVTGADALIGSGAIFAGRIKSLFVGGSIIAGTDNSTGLLLSSGAVRAASDILSMTVKGSLIGNRVGDGQDVLITAGGAFAPTATADVAIKSIVVGGRVEFARILAGYDGGDTGKNGGGGVNADAQIGTVIVGGDWIASSIAAGASDGGDGFGNANDAKLTGGSVKNNDDSKLVSKIASIVIKGQALGTLSTVNNTDFFGFVAQQIGSFKIGATAFPLTAGKANDTAGLAIGTTPDLRVREIAL